MRLGGHLDNAQLLSLVSEVRARFFQNLGYAEADVADVDLNLGGKPQIIWKLKNNAWRAIFDL